MQMNISREVYETVVNSLRSTRLDLMSQARSEFEIRKFNILLHQIGEVEEALRVFEEFDTN